MCPHCHHHSTSLLSFAYNHGSAQSTKYRCDDCHCVFELDRQLRPTILERGWTKEEGKAESLRFAAVQSAMLTLHKNHAPDHWYRFV